MNRPLFLRWVLLNSTLAVGTTLLVLQEPSRIHGAALVALPLIGVLYVAGAALAGACLWQTDLSSDGKLPRWTANLRAHRADLLVDIAEECQFAGMLCMIGGFYIILSGHFANASDIVSQVENGGPLALGGTFVGVLASRLLALQHRWIVRASARRA